MTELEQATTDGPDDWSAQFGSRLRDARDRAGMSQEEVAKKLGCTNRSVTRWENGESDPGFGKVARLAALLEVSLDWIANRTPMQQVVKPGMVMVNSTVQDQLQDLIANGKTLTDLPDHLVRHPGIDYVCVVPENALVLGSDAAKVLDARVQQLAQQLRRKKR